MKHRVIIDRGLNLGGRHYRHGEIINSEALVADLAPAPALPATATAEEKAAAAQAQEDAKALQLRRRAEAVAELKAYVDQGKKEGDVQVIEPVDEKPAPASAGKSAKAEKE